MEIISHFLKCLIKIKKKKRKMKRVFLITEIHFFLGKTKNI